MEEVKIYTARDGMEAHFLRNLLEGEGVVATVHGEALYTARGDLPEMRPSVWVMEGDAERATEIAEGMLKKNVEEPVGEAWTCPKCHEKIEPQFDVCWNCDSERPAEGDVSGPAQPA